MPKKLAIMQPYIFPYIGYFQLVDSADEFIFLNDVNFTKKGWIHRNQIIVNKRKHLFSVPLDKKSQNKTIDETNIHHKLYGSWKEKFSKTLKQNYSEAPHFNVVDNIVTNVLKSKPENITDLSSKSITAVAEYLDINTSFEFSSNLDYQKSLRAEDRIIKICQLKNASTYYNLYGGKELYSHQNFKKEGIDLKFLQVDISEKNESPFPIDPYISSIHLMMYFEKQDLKSLLKSFKTD